MKDSKSEKTTSTLKNTNNIYTKASHSARCSLILFEKREEIVTSPVFLTRVQYTHWQHLAISERNRIKQVSKTGALRASRLCSYAHWSFIQCEGFLFFLVNTISIYSYITGKFIIRMAHHLEERTKRKKKQQNIKCKFIKIGPWYFLFLYTPLMLLHNFINMWISQSPLRCYNYCLPGEHLEFWKIDLSN